MPTPTLYVPPYLSSLLDAFHVDSSSWMNAFLYVSLNITKSAIARKITFACKTDDGIIPVLRSSNRKNALLSTQAYTHTHAHTHAHTHTYTHTLICAHNHTFTLTVTHLPRMKTSIMTFQSVRHTHVHTIQAPHIHKCMHQTTPIHSCCTFTHHSHADTHNLHMHTALTCTCAHLPQ